MILIVMVFAITFSHYEVGTEQTFEYEKMNNYGLGRRIILNYRRMNKDAYPEPLPTTKPEYVRSPYRRVYQGVRRKNDRRVYNERFSYQAQAVGHQIIFDAVLDCIITHIAVETASNVPIIFRGGAGYRYFVVVVKAVPGVDLSGRVRAFCKNFNEIDAVKKSN